MIRRKKSLEKHPPQARFGAFIQSAPLGVSAGVVLIAVAALIAYFPCIAGEFGLDDELLLTNNPLVKVQDGLCRLWCTNEAPEYYSAA
ncbi:MAG: hypothetical protein ABSE63_12700 [Thermoguttaceae bacterium]|jgi:hypothetical protein